MVCFILRFCNHFKRIMLIQQLLRMLLLREYKIFNIFQREYIIQPCSDQYNVIPCRYNLYGIKSVTITRLEKELLKFRILSNPYDLTKIFVISSSSCQAFDDDEESKNHRTSKTSDLDLQQIISKLRFSAMTVFHPHLQR